MTFTFFWVNFRENFSSWQFFINSHPQKLRTFFTSCKLQRVDIICRSSNPDVQTSSSPSISKLTKTIIMCWNRKLRISHVCTSRICAHIRENRCRREREREGRGEKRERRMAEEHNISIKCNERAPELGSPPLRYVVFVCVYTHIRRWPTFSICLSSFFNLLFLFIFLFSSFFNHYCCCYYVHISYSPLFPNPLDNRRRCLALCSSSSVVIMVSRPLLRLSWDRNSMKIPLRCYFLF